MHRTPKPYQRPSSKTTTYRTQLGKSTYELERSNSDNPRHTIVGPPSAEKKPRRSRIFRTADPIVFTIRYRSRGKLLRCSFNTGRLLIVISDALRQLQIIPPGEAYIDAPLGVDSKQNAASLKRKRSAQGVRSDKAVKVVKAVKAVKAVQAVETVKAVKNTKAVKTVTAVKDTTAEDDILPNKRRTYLNRSKSEKQGISRFQRFTRAPAATRSVPAIRPLGVLERSFTTVNTPVNHETSRNQEISKNQRQIQAPAAKEPVPVNQTLRLFLQSSTTVNSRLNHANSAAAPTVNGGAENSILPSISDRNKKRKALEEELEDIDLKQRFVKLEQQHLYLEQRKCHAKRKLAQLGEDVE